MHYSLFAGQMTRNQWIAIVVVAVLILIALGIGIAIWMRRSTPVVAGRAPKPINVSSIMPTNRTAGKAKTTRILQTPTLRKTRGRPL